MGYNDVFAPGQNDPETFGMAQAKALDWVYPPTNTLNDDAALLFEGFTNAHVNTCDNAVDRHLENGQASESPA